ncbi:caspase family protein [Ferdinandcohnia sp. SAFN-114]|uniref:caspase family protein n=1 Tax=Ferdinandcohnia sp. SAFN-114 TaxID=3387275 RepID=UPI003F81FEBC
MRKALIVGLNDYPDAPLEGCVNDAYSVSNVLQRNSDGSPNFDVMLITDRCTKGELKRNIKALFEGDNEIALMYFSGHGTVTSTGGYIVTTDYSEEDEGVSMDEILVIANRSKAKNKIIILDCCNSGVFGTPSIQNQSNLTSICDGLTVLTASKEDESAMEFNGSGIFSSLLVEALHGGAADLRGDITPGSVYSYIDRALGAWDQRPVFKTNVSTFTSLRKVVPPIPLDILRKIKEYFPSPEEYFKLDPSFEPTSENPNSDNVEIFGNLQKMVKVGLVVPVDEEHMYYAAMNYKACRLTATGYHYWKLTNANRI